MAENERLTGTGHQADLPPDSERPQADVLPNVKQDHSSNSIQNEKLNKLRQSILIKREKGQKFCFACTFYPPKIAEDCLIQNHYIIPKVVGGTEEIKNKIDLCPLCHQIAHYLMRNGKNFNTRSELIEEIRKFRRNFCSFVSKRLA